MRKDKVLNYNDPPTTTADMVVNALIQAGFNFFTTLAGIGATGAISDPKLALIACGISAGMGFFGSLMLQRGVKSPEKPT